MLSQIVICFKMIQTAKQSTYHIEQPVCFKQKM